MSSIESSSPLAWQLFQNFHITHEPSAKRQNERPSVKNTFIPNSHRESTLQRQAKDRASVVKQIRKPLWFLHETSKQHREGFFYEIIEISRNTELSLERENRVTINLVAQLSHTNHPLDEIKEAFRGQLPKMLPPYPPVDKMQIMLAIYQLFLYTVGASGEDIIKNWIWGYDGTKTFCLLRAFVSSYETH